MDVADTRTAKADQLIDLAASALDWAREIKDTDNAGAQHAVAAGKLYITLADILRTGTPRRRWISSALSTADMHNAQAGMEPCKALVMTLLYGKA